MPAKPNRGAVYRTINVVAAADRTAGAFVTEGGWTGMVSETTKSGNLYALQVEGIVKASLASCAMGDAIYITSGNALTKTASGNTLFGKVCATPTTEPVDCTATNDIWIWLRQA